MSIYTHTSIVRDGSNIASFVFQVRLFSSLINASLILTIPIFVRLSSQRNSLQDQRNRPLDWVGLEGEPWLRVPKWTVSWVQAVLSRLLIQVHAFRLFRFVTPFPSHFSSKIFHFLFHICFINSICLCVIENLVSLQRFCCYHVKVISDKTESKVSLFVHCFLLNAHSFIFLLNALSHVFFIFLY